MGPTAAHRWTLHPHLLGQPHSWPAPEPHVPDIVLYEDLAAGDPLPSTVRAHRLRILELGYTEERALDDKLVAKLQSYRPAVGRLEEHGHDVSMKAQAIGARVPTVRREWESPWQHLGIHRDRHRALHAKIWAASITYLRALVVTWRVAASQAAGDGGAPPR